MSEVLYIVIPTFNEEENIADVVGEWYPKVMLGADDSRIVVGDGGSNDRTLDILRELSVEYPNLDIENCPIAGHGPQVLHLYNLAIERGADWVFQTDSDGQTVASEFDSFWHDRLEYDCVIGNRVHRGDGLRRWTVELVLRCMLKAFFGVMVPDANAPFRLMRSDVLGKYLDLMPETFNIPNAVLTALFAKSGERIVFREVTFNPRRGGKNSINLSKIIRIGAKSLSDFAHIRQSFRKKEL